MKIQLSRRHFLKTASVTGMGFWVAAGNTPRISASVNEQITVAGIGVGGKGGGDIENASRWGKVVAVCDADRGRAQNAQKKYGLSTFYTDYRKMFDEQGDRIDAVTVSTSDHMHAPISLLAMASGKHVYSQKPLTRTVSEARKMGNVAAEKRVCTQMGNQGSAEESLRRASALLNAGAIGHVAEIHVWTNRPIWPQGMDRMTLESFSAQIKKDNPDHADEEIGKKKAEMAKGLENLDWESWIGAGKFREFYPRQCHDFVWRGWWDFGTGALGDIGCHSLNMAFVGLNLRNPAKIIAKTSGHHFDSFPKQSVVTWEFPELGGRKALIFKWYDGGLRPDTELLKDHGINPEDDNGSLILGDEGYMVGTGIRKGKTIDPVSFPPVTKSEFGTDAAHSLEWGNAIRNGKPETCWSNFPNVAGPLAEMILAGNLAVWTANKPDEEGELIEWDAQAMKITNHVKTSGLEELIHPVYRQGW
ncbi:MAG: Gfo/Idh/MocA family oxidoreductase [Planctomycetaceae bacterium]|jgi:predicted dehydrogenase|nr:Gfo/Idh/MocA family oxidoreductase [Planctomycetaceae bacterium]